MNISTNICIIAHVDHGKTTLFNSIIIFCKNFLYYKKKFFFKNNYLYTIKCNVFSIIINNKIISFIDCPGHFDFVNDIYKSINVSNFCFILIDLKKGVEPQTLFCYNISKKNNKKIIIFINKIDFFFNLKKLKNKLFFFKKNQRIFFISSKYKIGFINLFLNNNLFLIKKNKIIFILEYLNNLKHNNIIIVKIIQGIILINDVLKNKFNNKIKILKIGIFTPKNFFIKKTIINCIHFLIINKFFNNILFFFSNKNIFFFNKINTIIYFNVYLNFNFYILKLINNDFSIFFKKEISISFGENYLLGFIGFLHSEIFFKKLKILSNFWVTNIIILFLFNKNNFWFINFYNKNDLNEYEQIVIVNLYILKKHFFIIIKHIFNINFYKIKIKKFENLLIITFYINLYKIINNFFYYLSKKINGFLFYEFKFHHFLKSSLLFLKIYINNLIINEFNLILEKNYIEKCLFFFNKIKNNIKNIYIDVEVKFIYKKKVFFRKKIFTYKKNVLEKCYGGDITRKLKLINKQIHGKKEQENRYDFCLNKKIIINILKHEFSNI